MHDGLIAFGSNEGNSSQTLDQAVDRLNQVEGIVVSARSRAYQTVPIGGPKGQDAYLNAAIRVETTLSPQNLHQALIQIESSLGRERRTRWGARKIDLDLLLFDILQLDSDKLTIPHPRMSFRRFVLDPACEIAGEMIHPTSGLSLNELADCMNRENMVLVVDADESAEFASMVRDAIPSTWNFLTTVDLESYQKPHETIKLACLVDRRIEQRSLDCGEESIPDAVGSTTVRFAGPSLQLTLDLDKSRLEILAAIEAMSH